MGIIKIKDLEDGIASKWLLFKDDRKAEYMQFRESIEKASPAPSDGMPRGGGVSNPTLNKAMKLTERDREAKWIELIEEVEGMLEPHYGLLLRLRREHRNYGGRIGWVRQVQCRINHSDKTLYNWWGEIVEFVVRQAAKKGLL